MKNDNYAQSKMFKRDKYKVTRAIECILHGFDWNNTEEGSGYWKNVVYSLEKIERIDKND